MRVGLVTGEFPSMEGGVGAFSQCLAQAMGRTGHEVHVVTHREARPALPEGNRYTLAQLREPVETEWGFLHPVGRRWGWGDVSRIAQMAIRYDLDVINIQYQAAAYNMRNPAINLAPWRLKGITTTLVTFHDLRVPYLFPKAGRLREYVVRLAARKSHGVIVTNAADRHKVETWSLGTTQIAEIPIGSNILTYKADGDAIATVRKSLGVGKHSFLVGYFGFLNPSKGADLLVKALATLDEGVHLVFIGGRVGSSDRKNNERFVEQVDEAARESGLTDRVHATGFLPDKELSLHLQSANVIVMPYRDGASLRRGTLMAALTHGRPVISTEPQVPVAALKHGENIWLVSRNDAQALAAAIELTRKDDALRERLATGAKELGQLFSWQRIAAQTLSFYGEVVSQESAPSHDRRKPTARS